MLDVGDAAVAEFGQMGDDEAGAGEVVVGNGVVGGGVAVPADDHGRHGTGDALEALAGGQRCDQDDAVHVAVDHGVGDVGLAGLVVAGRGDQHLIVGAAELRVDAVEDIGEERVAEVRQHHADGVGLAPHPARRRGRAVAELVDRGADLGLHLGAGAVRVAQHLRHRGGGHPGVFGHVDNRDPAYGRWTVGHSISLSGQRCPA
jgi:hypothetical protein